MHKETAGSEESAAMNRSCIEGALRIERERESEAKVWKEREEGTDRLKGGKKVRKGKEDVKRGY
jgi:hypothetical protein